MAHVLHPRKSHVQNARSYSTPRLLTLNVIHAGFGGEDSLNLPLMDPSLEAYLLQKDEESDEVR